jgi:hypothetical protein
MCAQDWALKYDEIWDKYETQAKDTHDLTTTLIRKQEMYILREQEYRNTIVQLKKQIETKSQKPLELAQEKTDD